MGAGLLHPHSIFISRKLSLWMKIGEDVQQFKIVGAFFSLIFPFLIPYDRTP